MWCPEGGRPGAGGRVSLLFIPMCYGALREIAMDRRGGGGYLMDMEAVSFDTLKLARRLESSGLTASVSAGVSEALADVLSTTALATKADVIASETAVRHDMKEMETSIRGDMKEMETSLRHEMTSIRGEMKDMETSIRGDMKKMETSIRYDMKEMETSIRHDMQTSEAAIRADMKASEAAIRGDLKAFEISVDGRFKVLEAAMNAGLEILRRDITVKVGGMLVVAVTVILAAMRYMPPRL
jgi:hypothetical protein